MPCPCGQFFLSKCRFLKTSKFEREFDFALNSNRRAAEETSGIIGRRKARSLARVTDNESSARVALGATMRGIGNLEHFFGA
jgi:hypothetical protein